ncbi:MAG TPA: methenyltetrahydromethanopterin cyclohydrolase [Planctomycetaceae bacterium]|nr:methenyltetrahydromethanopterin cyclohydrolase [Planctomycetaceae bacterium]
MPEPSLNHRAAGLVEQITALADDLRVRSRTLPGGGRVLDFGVETAGGLEAGRWLARVSMSGLGDVSLAAGDLGGVGWPLVQVATDRPLAACLLSQYAGWQISVGKFFGMGSGPMRAAAGREELFETLGYRETPTSCVGVLESGRLPDDAVFEFLAERTGIPARDTVLLVAPTASAAGNFQVVARSVETALHKLFELHFDVSRIESSFGTAPLAPVAADDLTGIGRTNDAILYGGRVTLWVRGDDESIAAIGPQVPSVASAVHGRPFLEIFEDAGRDFYAIDPHLFSPAEVVFQNLDSGRVHQFGRVEPEILRQSFGTG